MDIKNIVKNIMMKRALTIPYHPLDKKIHKDILKINRKGYETEHSCQGMDENIYGKHSITAFVFFKEDLPKSILENEHIKKYVSSPRRLKAVAVVNDENTAKHDMTEGEAYKQAKNNEKFWEDIRKGFELCIRIK